ncbi:type II toxin-antitoxin system RelE/ParE family toxin [Streptomyces sp. HUAS MG47]|uniref:type II toxin-antitoxin system RelE family toxin n=1 Tax=Streptomyces solicamelliae TaxID=3231716 RepID=UPI003877B850
MAEFRRLRQADPVGAKACAAGCPPWLTSRARRRPVLSATGYYRLSVGAWRVLYRVEDQTITVHVAKVGRVP